MSRVAAIWRYRPHKKLLVPFFTVGYPGLATSLDLIKVSIDAGADMVELGMPFSDPMADGPEIQFSSSVALKRGIDLTSVLKTAEQTRRYSDLPIILMGYYNPVHSHGLERFVKDSADAGVDGFIIPDLPVEEGNRFRELLDQHDLSAVFLVAPTSPPNRVSLIDAASTDFVYAVTVAGVTGGNKKFDRSVDKYLKGLRKALTKPFVAGFGVSSPESARRLGRYADGVVIGSALIRTYRTAPDRDSGIRSVGKLLADIRKQLD
ncbi:tryptophan synthase subunit alpha [candidate division GN15 bacterium]|nr:tryptophan synthase subunit alpha [candidate division GN15 bacterium]